MHLIHSSLIFGAGEVLPCAGYGDALSESQELVWPRVLGSVWGKPAREQIGPALGSELDSGPCKGQAPIAISSHSTPTPRDSLYPTPCLVELGGDSVCV